MKQSRVVVGAAVLLLLLIIFVTSWQLLNPDQTQPAYTISVLVSDSSANRWRAFREGLEQGAQEGAVILNVVSTGSLNDISTMAENIRREVSGGADALIVAPCADDAEGLLAGALSSAPAVLVETGISGEERIDTVSVDGYELGAVIAGLIQEDGEITEQTTYGILSGNQQTLVMQACLRGLLDTLGANDDQVRWTLSQKTMDTADMLQLSMTAKPVDVLIALDSEAMEQAIDYLLSVQSAACRLYGQGRSERCMYYLDTGLIAALAVPDEFMMGYQAVTQLLQKLDLYSPAVRTQEVRILSVTQENLYNADIAGLLFPTVS